MMPTLIIPFFISTVMAQTVLPSSAVVSQGSLGVCASASLSTILEVDTKVPVSFIDIAINNSWAVGSLFSLEGSEHFTLLSKISAIGVCPRSESFYEAQGNLDDSLGMLHSKLMNLLSKISTFSYEERQAAREFRAQVVEQVNLYQSPAEARKLLKSSQFIKLLYKGAKAQKKEMIQASLEWVDSFIDYHFTVALEENLSAAEILAEVQGLMYSGDAWEKWLKKNVIKSAEAKKILSEDLKGKKRNLLLAEVQSFTKILYQHQFGTPEVYTGAITGVKKEVGAWIYKIHELIVDHDLIPSQTEALLDILTANKPKPGSPEYRELETKTYQNLRKFFRVNCELNSPKRISINLKPLWKIHIAELRQSFSSNWNRIFNLVQEEIGKSLKANLPVGLSYDVERGLLQKVIPSLANIPGPSGLGHASVITAMRVVEGKREYLVHNSFGKDCERYYDPKKCDAGKIWVSEERIIPYTDSLNFFELK